MDNYKVEKETAEVISRQQELWLISHFRVLTDDEKLELEVLNMELLSHQ